MINYGRWLNKGIKVWQIFKVASNFNQVLEFMYMKFYAHQSKIVDWLKKHAHTHADLHICRLINF